MSYYGVTFAGINSGWYRKTKDNTYAIGRKKIDEVWSEKCDEILEKFVFKYGTFFTAFEDEIIIEIDKLYDSNLFTNARYYEYYIANRAFEISKTREFWIQSHIKESNTNYNCTICNKTFQLINCHPTLINQLGIPPKYCRDCNYLVRHFQTIWNDNIKNRLSKLMQNTLKKRNCVLCNKKYSIDNNLYTYKSFGGKSVNFCYPNLFFNICPSCFNKIFSNHMRGSKKLKLSRLYQLYELIKKIPTQDFDSFFYQKPETGFLLKLCKLLKLMPTPAGYKKEFGSFFSALVHSKILPNGSRQLAFGTMILAKDGHVCMSKREKEIDDYLFEQQITHNKEVNYPNSKMRTDWEIVTESKQIFIEYFGLIQDENYAKKVELKKEIAKNNSIELISIFPDDNWIEILNKIIEVKF